MPLMLFFLVEEVPAGYACRKTLDNFKKQTNKNFSQLSMLRMLHEAKMAKADCESCNWGKEMSRESRRKKTGSLNALTRL